MLSFMLATLLGQAQPPFRKAFDFSPESMGDEYAVVGDWIYYGAFGGYGRVNARTGKPGWKVALPKGESDADVAALGSRIFVFANGDGFSERERPGRLMEVDPATGKKLWSVPRKQRTGRVAFASGALVAEGPYGTLTATDLKTHRLLWTRKLSPKSAEHGIVALRTVGKRIFAGTYGGSVVAISGGTGKELWKREFPAGDRPLLDASEAVVLAGGNRSRLEGLDPATGKTRWFRSDIQNSVGGVLSGGIAMVAGEAKVHGLAPADGKERWTATLDSPVASLGYSSVVQKGVLYGRTEAGVFALGLDGKKRWEWSLEDGGGVQAVTANGFILGGNYRVEWTGGDTAIHAFTMGEPPKLPTDAAARQARAKELLARYPKLSVDEQRDLKKLGRDALDPLLDRFMFVAKEYERAEAAGQEGYPYYSELEDHSRLLAEILEPRDTDRLIALYKSLPKPSHGRFRLLGLIAAKGDPMATTPLFLDVLRQGNPDPSYTWTEPQIALQVVSSSPHPEAAKFMLERLRDPKTDPQVRQTAYTSLPLHGDAEARKAILALRRTERELPPLAKRLGLDELPAKPQKDSDLLAVSGSHGLMRSPLLGSYGDLYVVERVNGKWARPRFTGVNTRPSQRRLQPGEKPEPKVDLDALLKGGWIKAFVGNPKLAADADGDGLNDMAEARLGTDPKKADTDGDGLRDDLDRNPLVAPRELSEDEKILWVAYEARYRFEEDGVNPFIVTFPGNPFELPGRDGYALGEGRVGSAQVLFGTGPGYIRLSAPQGNGEYRAVSIGTTYAGLNGTGYRLVLKKIDGEWFVVSSAMEWIS